MSDVIRETIRGALQIDGPIDRDCFSSWQDFIAAIPRLISVEIPSDVGGVVVQQATPSEDDRQKLWLRLDNSGGFVGLFIFAKGKWQPYYAFVAGQIIWMTGNSASVPDGFSLVTKDVAGIPSTVVNALMSQYVPNGLGGYSYFAAIFVGY